MASAVRFVRVFCWALIIAAFFSGWASPGIARAFDEELEGKAVRDLFEKGLSGAFAALDVDRILDYYSDSALIVTHSMGRGDKSLFRKTLTDDFSRMEKMLDSSWQVESLAFENEVATARVLISEKVVTSAGDVLNRGAGFYYRLMKSDGRWKIVMQSYREDFGLTPVHGGPGGGPPHPAPPSE